MDAERDPRVGSPNGEWLVVRGLRVTFGAGAAEHVALDGVDFEMRRGETLALVGDSGSGKSTLALSLARLLPAAPACRVEGSIRFEGRDVNALDARGVRELRGARIGYVFQDPSSALHPLMRVVDQVSEAVRAHSNVQPREATDRARALLAEAELDPDRVAGAYPHECSGGMRQRVQLAMALAHRPALLVLDEPTTALDTVTQKSVFDTIDSLRARHGFAVLLVTHDSALARSRTARFVELRNGRVVREGAARERVDAREAIVARPVDPSASVVMSVKGLTAGYEPARRTWRRAPRVDVIHDVTFDLARGEILAVVGGSGAGKSTLARALLRLVEPSAGSVRLRVGTESRDVDWLALRGDALRRARPDVGLVFQDPFQSLDPRRSVREHLEEAAAARHTRSDATHPSTSTSRPSTSPSATPQIASHPFDAHEALEELGLAPRLLERLPHQLSGGERQRVCVARALATSPRVLVLDEAVSSLDPSTRERVLACLARRVDETGLACVFVTHDLASVERRAHRVAVLHEGRIVETGPTESTLRAPRHAVTRALVAARP